MFISPNLYIISALELTNAMNLINTNIPRSYLLWMMLASTFGGLSIHTQIKSILSDTSVSYKYFFLGRLLASIPLFFLTIIN